MQTKQPEQWTSSLKQAPSCLKQALDHFNASENWGLPMLEASVILGVVWTHLLKSHHALRLTSPWYLPRLPQGKPIEATCYKPLNLRQADIQASVFIKTSLGRSLNCCLPDYVERPTELNQGVDLPHLNFQGLVCHNTLTAYGVNDWMAIALLFLILAYQSLLRSKSYMCNLESQRILQSIVVPCFFISLPRSNHFTSFSCLFWY